MTARPLKRQSLRTVFAAPLAIAIASCVGLLAALLGDGLFDALSALCLSVPAAAVIWAWIVRKRPT